MPGAVKLLDLGEHIESHLPTKYSRFERPRVQQLAGLPRKLLDTRTTATGDRQASRNRNSLQIQLLLDRCQRNRERDRLRQRAAEAAAIGDRLDSATIDLRHQTRLLLDRDRSGQIDDSASSGLRADSASSAHIARSDEKHQLHASEIEPIRIASAQVTSLERHAVADTLAAIQQVQLGKWKSTLFEHFDQGLTYQADRSYNRNSDKRGHHLLHASGRAL
ncbi:hypothetical protein Pstu01_00720 [Stutzerimonas stutzeri]|nr:hypothetical protein Pstu01_00720 [Stutzerimonas stutzeri]